MNNIFDYKGYSEEMLFKLSKEQTIPYILREAYSFGWLIKEYGFFSSLFPINIYHLHGAGKKCDTDAPFQHEIDAKKYCECMFVNNSSDVKTFQKIGFDCKVMLHPFVYYRKSRKIEKLKDAKGTIVFPSHVTPDVDDFSDIQEYVNQIKALPEIYKPINICLSWVDISQGRHKIWIENGFPVYTIGHAYHEDFVKRFYELVRNYKFMTSNSVGSQLYYAVEMGIPFFIYGNPPKYFNKTDPGHQKGEINLYTKKYIDIYNLFNKITTEINKEQKQAAVEGLGVNEGISRVQMMVILYKGFFKNNCIYYVFKNIIKYIFKSSVNKNKFKLFLSLYNIK